MTDSLTKLRIGLTWHSTNSDNLGVGALTLGNIAIIEEAARKANVSPHFVVIGWNDAKPSYVQGRNVETIGLRLKDFVKPAGGLYSHLRGCDLILDIGAGDSFTDIYGMKRFGTVLGSKLLTIAARRPLILSPQTIGPFNRSWVRRLALAAMNRSVCVASRDDLSTGFLRDIGYRNTIIEASDVALRMPYEPADRSKDGKVRIGLNVSGLLFNGGYTRGNMFGLKSSYADLIRTLLRKLGSHDAYEVLLVAHVISDGFEVEDDYRVSQKLAQEFPGVIVAPKFSSPVEAKSYISGLDFFAGARMHACIAAFSTGVPVLPMAYSRKFAGLFGSLGYHYLADCQNEDDMTIAAKFEDGIARRDVLRKNIETSLPRGLARLHEYENLVTDTLTTVRQQRGGS